MGILERLSSIALLLGSVGVHQAMAQVASASICESAEFAALEATPLDGSPISVKALTQDDEICIEYSFTGGPTVSEQPSWFAVGLGRTAAMVSDPYANVLLFQAAKGVPESYEIRAYAQTGVVPEEGQSSFQVGPTGELKFSYQRKLAAVSPADVAIDLTTPSTLIWAYGTTWPIAFHRAGTRGVATFDFASGVSASSDKYCTENNCTAIIGAITFGVMLLAGFVVSMVLKSTGLGRVVLHRTLASPPMKATTNAVVGNPLVLVLQNLADLRVGEFLIISFFVGAVIAVIVAHRESSNQVVTGQVALIVLMFLILPISRIPVWSIVFGSSFERIVKFHRWLGMCFSVAMIVHLVLVIDVASVTQVEQFGQVVPLYGFIAFLCFISMAVLANEYIRRKVFELFYLSHRTLSIVGFVFVALHAPRKIGFALLVPLGLYGLSLIWRWWSSFSMTYNARVSRNDQSAVTVVQLQSSAKTIQWATTMNPCSYFWVQFPSVSLVQWHPFSAIVSPHGDTIGFSIKSMGSGTFTQALLDEAAGRDEMPVRLCGPFGKLSINVDEYDVLIMAAGGIGITPMLSLINQQRLRSSKLKAELHVIWSVRDVSDLLMTEAFMPDHVNRDCEGKPIDVVIQNTAPNDEIDNFREMGTEQSNVEVQWHCHVSKASSDGLAASKANSARLEYRAGRPILEEYINNSRFAGQRVSVLACGPPTMVAEAQTLARSCGFDFHKEVFNW